MSRLLDTDAVLEERHSPNHENVAVLLGRGRAGAADSKFVVVLREAQSTPAMDDEGRVRYPVLVCPEDASPDFDWDGSHKLVIRMLGKHYPNLRLTQTKWEDVDVVLNK